jgi:hypothetical protein
MLYLFFVLLFVTAYSAHDELIPHNFRRPDTGWYANSNPDKTILIEGRFFGDPPG